VSLMRWNARREHPIRVFDGCLTQCAARIVLATAEKQFNGEIEWSLP
jgi:hypothetical protein